MSHKVKTMIVLKFLPAGCRVFRTAYRMHEAGLQNMINDAKEQFGSAGPTYWKIQREDVETRKIIATLASGTGGTVSNISPLVREAVEA